MVTLAPERYYVDPPETLPVTRLSVSSLNAFERCPEQWKRRYIDGISDRSNGKMLRGKAAGHALAQHFARQIDTGQGMSTEELLDEYAADWTERAGREDIDWSNGSPGELKDRGAQALGVYHRHIAPDIVAVAVERPFEMSWGPDVPFTLVGFIDLETADGAVVDFKASDKRMSADRGAGELQPTVYVAARRAEGNPADRFEFHCLIAAAKPTAEIVPSPRSERQLDMLTARVFSIARSIEWRCETGIWAGTGPDAAWMCRGCTHRGDCPWRRG